MSQNGLFWTTIVSDNAVDVDLQAGTATMKIDRIQQKDYFDFENAILGNGATPRQGLVSFTVRWTAFGVVNNFDNPSQQFRGQFRDAVAQMEWSGRSGDFEFRSAPLSTSTTDAAQLGQESNGSFY